MVRAQPRMLATARYLTLPQLKRIVSVRSLNGKEGGERAAKKGCSQDIATTVALHGTGAAHQNAPRHEPKWTRAGSFSRSRQSRCRTGPIREPPVAPWPEPRTGRCARFIAGPVEETWQDEVPVLCSSLCAESGHWSSLVPYALNSHCAAGAWHGRGLVCYRIVRQGREPAGCQNTPYTTYDPWQDDVPDLQQALR